jgi:hypothetical protein
MRPENKATPKHSSAPEPNSRSRSLTAELSPTRSPHQAVIRRLQDALETVRREPIPPGVEGSALLDALALAEQIHNSVRDQAKDVLKLNPEAFPGWHVETQTIYRLCRDKEGRP